MHTDSFLERDLRRVVQSSASIVHRVGARTFLVVLCAAVLIQLGLMPLTASAQTQPDWLVAINNVRTAAGLPAVPADSASTTGAIHHSRYIVLNNVLTHAEDSTKPGYTTDGDAAGQTGDVGSGYIPTTQQMLATFMSSAYHWEGILAPDLTSVGYGSATYNDVFPGKSYPGGCCGAAYTLVLNRTYASPPTKPIMWPPSGGTMPYTSFAAGEGPNPLANCAGYAAPTGAPLNLQLPSAPQVSSVTLTQAGVTGTLPSCWFTSSTVRVAAADQAWLSTVTSILTFAQAVVIFPQQTLANGTYCVSVTDHGTPINWSFTVGSSPVAAPAPCGSAPVATSTPVPTVPTATPVATAPGVLTATQGLNVNDQVLSPNGKTRLILQSDGNLCLYRVDNGAFLWCSGSAGKAGTHLVMQPDGNLVLYTSGNVAVWSSGTYGHPGATVRLGDDGNLVVVDQNGAVLWASNTAWNVTAPAATPTSAPPAPTATPAAPGLIRLSANQQLNVNDQIVSPNGKARLLMQSDGNLVLYRVDNGRALWASNTYGKPMTHALMQTDGNFVGYNSANSAAYWSSGSYGHPGASLVLRDDGNVLVVDANGAQLWATNTSVN